MTLSHLIRSARSRWIWLVWLADLLALALIGYSLLRYGYLDAGPRWGVRGAVAIPGLVYTTMGALILARHPRHRVGLLILWVGLGSTLQAGLEEYGVYGLLVAPGQVPGALFAAWLCNWLWIPVDWIAANLLPLYFPSGRLLNPRWRYLVALTFIGLGTMSVGFAIQPGRFGSAFGNFVNPFGLTNSNGAGLMLTDALSYGGITLTFIALGIAALILLRRLRQAVGVERQQLKWFVYAVLVGALLAPVNVTNFAVLHILYLVATTCVPIAIGLAVLRYRLYDIDLLVNRALVYGALTAILAAAYFGCVVILQNLLVTVTGERQSALATVLSTLAIAALFTPLRVRLQAFIDRRFYRRRYDAARTLAAFSVTIRDDVDLAVLRERLLQVVDDTIQPAEVGLWLKRPSE
jgi:hypothetical protein